MIAIYSSTYADRLSIGYTGGIGTGTADYETILPLKIDEGSGSLSMWQSGLNLNYIYYLPEKEYGINLFTGYSFSSICLVGNEVLPFNIGEGKIVDGLIDHHTDIEFQYLTVGFRSFIDFNMFRLSIGVAYNIITDSDISSYSQIVQPAEVLFPNGSKRVDLIVLNNPNLNNYLSLSSSISTTYPVSSNLYLEPQLIVDYIPNIEVNSTDDNPGLSGFVFRIGVSLGYDFSAIKKQKSVIDARDLTPNIEFSE